MERTFTVAGISTKHGVVYMRVANGTAEARRIALTRDHQTNINLHDLPHPMTKAEAAEWLTAQGIVVPTDAAQPRNFERKRIEERVSVAGKELVISMSSVPANEHEVRARKLHRKAPFIRWLAWDHLSPEQRAEFMEKAA